MKGLEERFTRFLKSLPDSECLDDSEYKVPDKVRKADFFLFKRAFVVELKSLKVDQSYKVDKHVDRHLEEIGAVVFGTVAARSLFESERDYMKFQHKILRDITRGIEKACVSANDQIVQTLQHFSAASRGLLVFLNESIDILDPQVVAHRICDYLMNKNRSIHYCLLIFESHDVAYDGERQNQLLMIARAANEGAPEERLLSDLMRMWAEWNGTEYLEKTVASPGLIPYVPAKGAP